MMRNQITFSHAGRQLTVKACRDNLGYKVRVFDGDRRACNVEYSVSDETQADGERSEISADLVERLMDIVKSDVKTGIVKLLP